MFSILSDLVDPTYPLIKQHMMKSNLSDFWKGRFLRVSGSYNSLDRNRVLATAQVSQEFSGMPQNRGNQKDPSKRFILFIVRTVETTLKLQDFRTPILILRQYRNPPAFSKGCYSNPKEWWFSAPKHIHSAHLGKSRHVLQCYLTKLNSRHVAGIPLTTQMGAMNFTQKIP